jgi:acetolactate synthase regulatory subunit
MRINFKQEELIKKIMRAIRRKFPEVRLIDVTESPDDPEILWLNMTAPEDEDREIELLRFGSKKVTDIMLDYGYYFLIMPNNPRDKEILLAA